MEVFYENKDEEEIIYMRPSDKMEIGNVSLYILQETVYVCNVQF